MPRRDHRIFATAEIRVQADSKFKVISQGKRTGQRLEGNVIKTTFVVDIPVPGFSLNIGPYHRLARQFNQTEIEVYFREQHLPDYEIFEEVADTCYQAVERMFEILEEVSGMPYPYPALALVEVPTQMQVYMTHHGIENVLLQPGVS